MCGGSRSATRLLAACQATSKTPHRSRPQPRQRAVAPARRTSSQYTTPSAACSSRSAHLIDHSMSPAVLDSGWYCERGLSRRSLSRVLACSRPIGREARRSGTAVLWSSALPVRPVSVRQMTSAELMPDVTAFDVAAFEQAQVVRDFGRAEEFASLREARPRVVRRSHRGDLARSRRRDGVPATSTASRRRMSIKRSPRATAVATSLGDSSSTSPTFPDQASTSSCDRIEPGIGRRGEQARGSAPHRSSWSLSPALRAPRLRSA